MPQPHPRHQLLRDCQYIPQHVDLQLVKVLVHVRLQQRLELMHALLDLRPRFRVHRVALAVCVGDAVLCGGLGSEAERGWVSGEQAFFGGVDGAVYELVDRVDYVVEEGLWGFRGVRMGLRGEGCVPAACSGGARSAEMFPSASCSPSRPFEDGSGLDAMLRRKGGRFVLWELWETRCKQRLGAFAADVFGIAHHHAASPHRIIELSSCSGKRKRLRHVRAVMAVGCGTVTIWPILPKHQDL